MLYQLSYRVKFRRESAQRKDFFQVTTAPVRLPLLRD